MAYDITAIRQALAQGRVDEGEATKLINEQADWETKVAKLLDAPAKPVESAGEVKAEGTPSQPAA